MSAIQEIYERQVKRLSAADRLALARLIMDELIGQASRWPEDSDAVKLKEDSDGPTATS